MVCDLQSGVSTKHPQLVAPSRRSRPFLRPGASSVRSRCVPAPPPAPPDRFDVELQSGPEQGHEPWTRSASLRGDGPRQNGDFSATSAPARVILARSPPHLRARVANNSTQTGIVFACASSSPNSRVTTAHGEVFTSADGCGLKPARPRQGRTRCALSHAFLSLRAGTEISLVQILTPAKLGLSRRNSEF
jgi:hypothetical protein